MTKKLVVAVLLVLSLDVLATGYGAVAAGHEAHATCTRDHGTVESHECVKDGQVLFGVPL